MNHLKSSLSKVSVVAVVLGLVACGHSNQQSQAQAPRNPAGLSTSEQYGSAMGQPGATGNEMGQPSEAPALGTPGPAAEQGSVTGEPGGAYGKGGATSGQGATGSEYGGGATPQTGGATGSQPGEIGQGATGQAGAMGPPGGSMDVSTLNDNQLAAVVQAINKGAIDEARLAVTKAHSPEVRHFAEQMVTAHGQAEDKQNTLFSRLQITPSDNTVSQALKTDTQTHLSKLQSLGGNDFDQAYMADQVRSHNNALELIDRAIPNVKNTDLKNDLQNVRAKIAAHLADAERIQQTVQKGSTNKQGGSGSEPH
jgi:putative membrane protein